jgi:hypothetical protein
MNAAICIDFGTSSIRAVARNGRGDSIVVPLGEVTESRSIDGASIPSAICVAADGETVLFGEQAYSSIKSEHSLLFWTTSPKLWLKEPHMLDVQVAPNVAVTRRDLLTGLLGYALFAARESGYWEAPADPMDADIRLAHPVWPLRIRSEVDKVLGRMVWLGAHMASAGDWGKTSVDVLASWTNPEGDEGSVPVYHPSVDTVEPVAAAVELLSGGENQRRLCVVIDVGAGTTDIGVFQQLIPDVTVKKGMRMIPAGPALSVFKAGDAVDEALISLIQKKFPKEYDAYARRIRVDIRRLKEDLFANNRLQYFGIDVSLPVFEESAEIRALVSEVKGGLLSCLQGAHLAIHTWFSSGNLMSRTITLLMAGGGAGLGFLRRALAEPLDLYGERYQVELIDAVAPRRIQLHGAGYTRLAVGLGGVREAYDRVVQEHKKLPGIPSLGSPKQKI